MIPFVSVVVPVYNAKNTLNRCVESLLEQTYPKDKYEVVMVDNGSKDNSKEILQQYPVIIEESLAQSSYAARNKGIAAAKGEILAFTDADCIADKYWIEKGVNGFNKQNVGAVAGEVKGFKPANYIEEYLVDKQELSQEKTSKIYFLPYAKTANVFYRKDVFKKIGGFPKEWISAGDADLAWRMQLETKYKLEFITEAFVYHRHRSTLASMFKQTIKWGIGYTYLYKKYKNKLSGNKLSEFLRNFIRMGLRLPIYFIVLRKGKELAKNHRYKYLDYISSSGWQIGKLIGSFKNKTVCF
jgi:cellulose synthase/poly-beta-1,6-N-acetylglucosamine synthase-like glycosyltransferase